MLIDMHAHSSAISRCCRATVEEVLTTNKSVGIDGIVLTNHYQFEYAVNGDSNELARRYTEEYYHAKEAGESLGMRVFYGMEVTARKFGCAHMLVYGIDPSFTLEHSDIYDYTLEEMSRAVHEAGAVLIQAHPFRRGGTLVDLNYVDGIEANCHPIYEGPCYDMLVPHAQAAGIIMTCGGDYHADTHRVRCGTYLPDFLTGGLDLANYLRTTDATSLVLEEPDTHEWYERVYLRKEG